MSPMPTEHTKDDDTLIKEYNEAERLAEQTPEKNHGVDNVGDEWSEWNG